MVHEDELHAGVSSTLSCLCLGRRTLILEIPLVLVDICLYGKSVVEIVSGRDEFLPIMCDRGSNSGIELGSELRDQELIYKHLVYFAEISGYAVFRMRFRVRCCLCELEGSVLCGRGQTRQLC
jgi:hypothetical protein